LDGIETRNECFRRVAPLQNLFKTYPGCSPPWVIDAQSMLKSDAEFREEAGFAPRTSWVPQPNPLLIFIPGLLLACFRRSYASPDGLPQE
jgi:hypothetical protein